MTYLIREMPVDDRPRERMFRHGAKTLSDAELLAVILGTGAAGKNAIHLAQELLHDGGVQALSTRDFATLAGARGVGPAKIARIGAVVELSRRMAATPKEEPKLYSAGTLGRQLVKTYSHHTQERFSVALLDARQRIMKHREIFVGTLDRTLVSTREVIRLAVIEHAKGVVIYHNHPSGDPSPSEDDVVFTRKLRESLEIVDIDFVDHLIIGAQGFVSLKERGTL
ncbi:MAG TPA: DNA repair protein RadC [Thermoanaerobaculia bacterium]|nr:DNA repair protein RadC [Thermoanaerobaculia bacterium]